MRKQHPRRRQTLSNKFEVYGDNLKRFIKEIRKLPVLENDELVQLVEQAQAGDRKAYEKVTNSSYRMLLKIAKEYHTPFLGTEDLVQEGYLGLHEAISKYNVKSPVPFILFAMWYIKSAVSRFLWCNHTGVKMPMGQQRSILNHLFEVHRRYWIENGIAPTDEDLQKLTGASAKMVAYFRQFPNESYSIENVPLEEIPMMSSQEERFPKDAPSTWTEESEMNSPEEITDRHIIREVLLDCLTQMTSQQQEFINDFFGLEGNPLSVREMAEKYSCTPSNIRQKRDRYLEVIYKNFAAKLKPYLD